MEQLQGLKVKITRGSQNEYPNFNLLQIVKDSRMPWPKYVDKYLGWHYDQTSDMRTESPDSPFGEWWGVIIVPVEFVTQAIAMFGDKCTPLTEAKLADFYDNKAHIKDPEQIIIKGILEGIIAKDTLNIARTDTDNKAIDPNDDTPGVSANKMKTWALLKESRNINIKA